MHRRNSAMLGLKIIFASFALLALARLVVGIEAVLGNGLALTRAEYVGALGEPQAAPTHLIVQAH